jgi:hypothetical protein
MPQGLVTISLPSGQGCNAGMKKKRCKMLLEQIGRNIIFRGVLQYQVEQPKQIQENRRKKLL